MIISNPSTIVFRYRLQSADGCVHIAIGDVEFVQVCTELRRDFGLKGYSLLLPIDRADVRDDQAHNQTNSRQRGAA